MEEETYYDVYTQDFFVIDQQIARYLCTTVNVLQSPLNFYETQIIYTFLNLRILANHDKGQGF